MDGACDAGRSCRGNGAGDPSGPCRVHPGTRSKAPSGLPTNQPTASSLALFASNVKRDMDITFVPFPSNNITRLTTTSISRAPTHIAYLCRAPSGKKSFTTFTTAADGIEGSQEIPSTKAISFEHLHITGSYRLSRGEDMRSDERSRTIPSAGSTLPAATSTIHCRPFRLC